MDMVMKAPMSSSSDLRFRCYKGGDCKGLVCKVFDELPKSDWRSPSRILEVRIHRVRFAINDFVLRRVFGRFGVVESVSLCHGFDHVEACVVFQSKHEAAEAYGELHGRNIFDGCCQMEIKWGLFQEHDVPVVTHCSSLFESTTSAPLFSTTTASSPAPAATTPTAPFPAAPTTLPAPSAAALATDLVHCGPVDIECIDRLSLLPDVLLGSIVSRLPIKDATRTAVLSRRWRPIWRAALLVLVDTHILPPGEDEIPNHLDRDNSITVAPTFYSPFGERYHSLGGFPLNIRRARCCGSGDGGWLALALDSPHAHALYNLNSTTSSPPTLLQAPSTSTVNMELALGTTGTAANPSDFSIAPRSLNHAMPEVLPVCVKVLDGELLKCGGLFSSSDWLEQQPWPPPHVQVEFKCDSAAIRPSPWPSFLLSNGCSMSWVVCWKPPWPLHPRQDIRCVPATALQEFLTCIMVISVGIVAAGLIQELVQRKCGGNCRCFLLEGSQLKDSVVVLCTLLVTRVGLQPWPPPAHCEFLCVFAEMDSLKHSMISARDSAGPLGVVVMCSQWQVFAQVLLRHYLALELPVELTFVIFKAFSQHTLWLPRDILDNMVWLLQKGKHSENSIESSQRLDKQFKQIHDICCLTEIVGTWEYQQVMLVKDNLFASLISTYCILCCLAHASRCSTDPHKGSYLFYIQVPTLTLYCFSSFASQLPRRQFESLSFLGIWAKQHEQCHLQISDCHQKRYSTLSCKYVHTRLQQHASRTSRSNILIDMHDINLYGEVSHASLIMWLSSYRKLLDGALLVKLTQVTEELQFWEQLWIIWELKPESRQHKCGDVFSEQTTFLSGLCCGVDLQNKSSSFYWDPGGAKLLYRLGGKPKLKKGGMSVYALGSMGRRVLSHKAQAAKRTVEQ